MEIGKRLISALCRMFEHQHVLCLSYIPCADGLPAQSILQQTVELLLENSRVFAAGICKGLLFCMHPDDAHICHI